MRTLLNPFRKEDGDEVMEIIKANGGMDQTGSFCEFYEEQVRYAFRLIADGKEDAFLWDDWDKEMTQTFAAP